MDMTATQRITAIQESATLLSEQTGSDVDLILAQHGIETPDSWEETLYTYVIHTIKVRAEREAAGAPSILDGESDDVPAGPRPWSQGQLKLFMSHRQPPTRTAPSSSPTPNASPSPSSKTPGRQARSSKSLGHWQPPTRAAELLFII